MRRGQEERSYGPHTSKIHLGVVLKEVEWDRKGKDISGESIDNGGNVLQSSWGCGTGAALTWRHWHSHF